MLKAMMAGEKNRWIMGSTVLTVISCHPSEGWYVQTWSQESHIKIFPSGWHSSNQKYTKIKQNHIYFLFYMCKQHNLQMWNAFKTSLLSSQSYYESKHLFDKLKSAEKQRLQIHKAEGCHIHLIWKSWEYEKDSTWLMFLQLTLFFFLCTKCTVGEDCLWFYLLNCHLSSIRNVFTGMTDHHGMGISSGSVLSFLYNLVKSLKLFKSQFSQ